MTPDAEELTSVPKALWDINRKHGATVGDGLLRAIAGYLCSLNPAYSAYRIANSRLTLLGPDREEMSFEGF